MKDAMIRTIRTLPSRFECRDEGGVKRLSGYFAVFNSLYEIAPGMSESIAPGAFSRTLQSADVRALINHDSTLVLGRTKANTLRLKEDEHGLWGEVDVNPNDTDAMNLWERVQRGDVDQCSFGFEIRGQDTEISDSGDVHWTLTDVELYEVSACTFPAYEETALAARSRERDEVLAHKAEAWKAQMMKRLKGDADGSEGTDAR